MTKKVLVVAAVLALAVAAVTLTNRPRPDGPPEGPEPPPDLPLGAAPAAASGTAGPAEPAPEAEKPRFRVRIRYPDGSPAQGAKVWLGEDRADTTADADGVAALSPTGGRARLEIVPRRAAPETREVEALAGAEEEITLRLGAVISGVLLLREEPAAEVEVHLNPSDGPQMVTVTDELGRFEFTGLVPDERFWFFAGSDVWFLDPPGEGIRGGGLHLVAPSTDLVLRADRAPTLSGRIVRPDGSALVTAIVEITYRDVEGGGGRLRTDLEELSDGRFSVPLSGVRRELAELIVVVTGPDGIAREAVEIPRNRLGRGDVDAGTIVLRPARTFEFVIRGPDGEPVPGAVVIPNDETGRTSDPADEAGCTVLAVPGGLDGVRIGAPGAGVADVPLPKRPTRPIEVELPGGTLLTVTARTPAGRVPANLGLLVEGGPGLREAMDPVYGRGGASSPGSAEWNEEDVRLFFLFPEDGTLRIAGIPPGDGFRVTVRDRMTDRRIETRPLALRPREHRKVDFVLPIEERSLPVHVVGSDGEPVRTWVYAKGPGRAVSATTDEEGVARLEGIRGEEIRVWIVRGGYVPFVRGFPVAELPERLEIVLRPGRSVRLTVTDPSGDPAECGQPHARAPGLDHDFGSCDEGAGRYRFEDLPEGEVRIFVPHAGVVHEIVVDPADGKASLTVPAAGSVVVRFDFRLDGATSHRIRLIPVSGATATEVTADIDGGPAKERVEVRIPAVLPGRYRVALEHRTAPNEPGRAAWIPVSEGPVVDVSAGHQTGARLAR